MSSDLTRTQFLGSPKGLSETAEEQAEVITDTRSAVQGALVRVRRSMPVSQVKLPDDFFRSDVKPSERTV
jgi:hypothetical protein